MNNRDTKRNTALSMVMGVLCIMLHTVEASIPVVTDIGIFSGKRGTAVTIKADAAITAGVNSSGGGVTIQVKNAVYGLSTFNFDKFPHGSLITKISVKEHRGSHIEISLSLNNKMNNQVKTVYKKNQFLALISSQPTKEFTWNAEKVKNDVSVIEKSVAVIPDKKERSRLNNIRLLERGKISELAFEFDRNVSGTIARKGKRITLSVEKALNGTGKEEITLPAKGSYKKIRITENKERIAISFEIDTATVDTSLNIAFTQGEVLSVFIAKRNDQKATLWTSGHGLMVDYKFYTVPSYTTDISSIEKKARLDVRKKINPDAVFSVKNRKKNNKVPPVEVVESEQQAPVETTSEQSEQQETVIVESYPMEVISDGVINMRKHPSLKGKIAKKLKKGDTLDFIRKNKKWVEVLHQGDTGFVYSTLLRKVEEVVQDPVVKNIEPIQTVDDQYKSDKNEKLSGITKVSKTAFKESSEKIDTEIQNVSIPALKEKKDMPELRQRLIKYTGGGRDPFKPIVSETVAVSDLPVADHLELVGVLVDDFDRIALCEDASNGNRPFTLREHDKVFKGKVLKIYRDKIVFLLTEYGISRSFTLSISTKKSTMEASKK